MSKNEAVEFPWLIVTTSPPSTQRKRKMAEITSDDGKSKHAAPAVFPDFPAEPIEDSAAVSTTTKEKTIEEKSSAEVQMAVDALLKEYEDECPERKKRQRKIKKYWDKKEKLLEKKHAQPTPSVAPEFEAALRKPQSSVLN